MKKLAAALAAFGVMLACASAASATLIVGVNDDNGKNADLSSWFYSTMESEGLTMNAVTLRWDDANPSSIAPADLTAVNNAIKKAAANGVTVELDLYPLHSQIFTGGQRCAPTTDPQGCGNTQQIQLFASWTALVAKTFPSVHEFIVMNECNQDLFVNPQYDQSGQNQSAEICGRALAGAYDAIHGVDDSDFVWGVGLSPRGNDNAAAANNSSTSPVKFLGDLGAWFKSFAAATHRTAPLMDGFDFHPYPIPQSLPFAQGYANPNDASVVNLPRIYQAFYSGFVGTPQKTIGQQAGGGLPVSLNEVGIQTDGSGRPGYTDTETAATSAGGVTGQYASEAYQSQWYTQMLNYVACDPNVQVVNIFHLIDDSSLAQWQSGLYYYGTTDPEPKESALAVKIFVQGGAKCTGAMQPWTPTGVAAAPTTTTLTTTVAPTPCTKNGATKAACLRYLTAQTAALVKLQKQVLHAKGKQKAKLKAKVAAQKKLVAAAMTALKKLKH
jgi:hypothetical protein